MSFTTKIIVFLFMKYAYSKYAYSNRILGCLILGFISSSELEPEYTSLNVGRASTLQVVSLFVFYSELKGGEEKADSDSQSFKL